LLWHGQIYFNVKASRTDVMCHIQRVAIANKTDGATNGQFSNVYLIFHDGSFVSVSDEILTFGLLNWFTIHTRRIRIRLKTRAGTGGLTYY
jgi:hypothetical protein